MSFSSASLGLLRRQLRAFEHSTTRRYKSTIHTNTRPRCPRIRHADTSNTSLLARRSFTTYSTPVEKLRAAVLKARQQNPILLPVLFLATIGSLSVLGLLAYDQYTRVDPLFAGWPAPVEQQLRVALHFTHVQPNPDRAAELFAGALKAAEKCGMDPFSKEVIGIRVRLAEMLEQFGRVKASIEVLKGIVEDCEERSNELSRETVLEALKSDVSIEEKTRQDQRTTILRCIIEVKVKMAQLYDSEYIRDSTLARKTLSDSIDLLVKNTQDPQTKGFSEDNAAGLSLEEISAILYDMGGLYMRTGDDASALQTYGLTLNVLRKACKGAPSCKQAQVLSHMANTMAMAADKPGAIINGKRATPQSVKAARNAALKLVDQSIETANNAPREEWEAEDSECHRTTIGALLTKAEMLHMLERDQESKEVWKMILSLSQDPEIQMFANSGIEAAESGINYDSRDPSSGVTAGR